MPDVFISHVEEDILIAEELAKAIEDADFTAWYYERDCLPGPSYLIQTGQAIETCKAVVLIVSAKSLGSHQVTKEVVRAHEEAKPFLPVLVDVTHVEFQRKQPEWREAVGAAASVSLLNRDLQQVCLALTEGLRVLLPSPDRPARGTSTAQPFRLSHRPGGPAETTARQSELDPSGQTDHKHAAAERPDFSPSGDSAKSETLATQIPSLLERAQSRWPGCEFLHTFESRGGSEILVVKDGETRKLVKRTQGVIVSRTAPPLDTPLENVVDEAYEHYDEEVIAFREYVEGVSLDRVMELSESPVHGALLGHWAQQIMQTLADLHCQGIVHRDISPANIVVTRDTLQPYLIDLKSAIPHSDTDSPPIGTQPYVAPEQLSSRSCFASDLYSLGILLVFLATGNTPPTAAAREAGDQSLQIMTRGLFGSRDGTNPIGDWLPKLVALDPEERFRDASTALQHQGISSTTPHYPCGVLSLGEGVIARMFSLGWQVEQEST